MSLITFLTEYKQPFYRLKVHSFAHIVKTIKYQWLCGVKATIQSSVVHSQLFCLMITTKETMSVIYSDELKNYQSKIIFLMIFALIKRYERLLE